MKQITPPNGINLDYGFILCGNYPANVDIKI